MDDATPAVEHGDLDVLRRRVDQLREQAVDVRSLADQLVAQTDVVGWTGRAATSMRERVAERAAHLRCAAADHETAADALEHHVREADRITETIADVERRATALVTDARSRLAARRSTPDGGTHPGAVSSGPDPAPDPADVTLAAFVAPPSGHVDWLAVDLPGLSEGTP